MKVERLSALATGHIYSPGLFLVLISVRGCIDPRAIVRAEGFFFGKTAAFGPGHPHCPGFMNIPRHTKLGRTPLDE